jgi:hypothetical protein
MAKGNRHGFALCLSLLLVIPEAAGAASGEPKSLEAQVKAAFLAKFAGYVNWPPTALGAAEEPLRLCIIGRDPFGPALDAAVSGQRVDQHPLQIRRLDSTAGATRCHIAYIGGSPKQSTATMLDALRGQPVLTVTDASFGSERGMMHFALKDGRVRFHIDDALAARGNLSISARLMSLALSVKPRGRLS